ncbi:gliding motility lipoprotein GldH [Costertonia aggregata]|uniref:Gliding motility lipoprotein GldH n=1 Tax=Costertonia aggregata TaxID=343403 RepID=A0A7H9APH0_9FLAO|nr:gliding motility lipoprotein GldH [Costertonia aggregata]QLG45320.1 gliding motility lipoprotein GldH [Costertonia aggregata]
MRNSLICLTLVSFLFSCNDTLSVSEYKATNNGKWNKDSIVSFSFSEMDTVSKHNVFINIRNDESYPFSNLFLIAELESPDGKTVTDTLEYEMADPSGEWLGKGKGSVKENKLWFKENIVFSSSGVYNLQISHAMRKNGNVNGIVELEGITDVGFQIEKSNQ